MRRATANAIEPDVPTSGQVASVSDEDWFVFSVGTPGTVRVTFDSPENSSSEYHTVQVRDGSGIILASVDTGRDTVFHATAPTTGQYFVVVRDGPYAFESTGPYAVTVTTGGTLPDVETEPNSHSGNASALVLGEKVGLRRWSAVAIGFLGVLIIVQPGSDAFNVYAFSALLAVVFVTARDLLTRRASTDTPSILITLASALTVTACQ